VVFQTAGPTIGAGAEPRPLLARALPAAGGRVRVELPPAEAVGRICFAALVRDLVGRTSGGGEREICVATVAPPFFVGCAFASGRGHGRGESAALILVGAGVLAAGLLRRRARRARGEGRGA
jgi:hypothetical protein